MQKRRSIPLIIGRNESKHERCQCAARYSRAIPYGVGIGIDPPNKKEAGRPTETSVGRPVETAIEGAR
jgi:hypothetical protein